MMNIPYKPMMDEVKYSFSGHETFPFRFTWLPKGVRYLEEYPDLFTRDDATVILGVGKNMVRSIRHWCEAVGVIESPSRGEYRPTDLGIALFDPEGWDPYLENPGTLWLLHWRLVSRWDRASTWFLAFTRWNAGSFTREQLVEWLMKLIEEESPKTRSTRASLKRDVDAFLRTYTPSTPTHTRPPEDTFDCPLVELGLITEIDRKVYQFVRGPKPALPDEIITYALLEFWNSTAENQRTISFETLLYLQGSPGAAFKMSENALAERLEHLPRWCGLRYDDTAGMRVLVRDDKALAPSVALRYYYKG